MLNPAHYLILSTSNVFESLCSMFHASVVLSQDLSNTMKNQINTHPLTHTHTPLSSLFYRDLNMRSG